MAEKKEKQYVSDNAQLMAEWDWEKNDAENLNPHHISYGSRQKAWWLCPKGHSYDATLTLDFLKYIITTLKFYNRVIL